MLQKLQKVKEKELAKTPKEFQLKMNLQVNSKFPFLLNNHNNR